MDITDEIRKVHRAVGSGDRGGVHTIVLRRDYPAPPQDVWEACTDPERLARWFEPVTGDLREGGRYRLGGSGTAGTVERCDPPSTLRVTWEFEGSVSVVQLDLTAERGGRTGLALRHEVPDDDHWARFGPAAGGIGWDLSLAGLALHLAGDPGAEPSALEEFAVSGPGREVTRWTAADWAAAHVAAGADEDVARAAADRTAAFYQDGTG